MPEKLNIDYDEHIVDSSNHQVEVRIGATSNQGKGIVDYE